MINWELRDLKEEIEDMSEQRKRNPKPKWRVNIVEKTLQLNRQRSGQGLEILTPDQMLNRLPISLAQLNAGNNSEKLKNKIRQLFYSLYRSKTHTKNIYKSFIDII